MHAYYVMLKLTIEPQLVVEPGQVYIVPLEWSHTLSFRVYDVLDLTYELAVFLQESSSWRRARCVYIRSTVGEL